MKLLEHEAKQILSRCQVPVPDGAVVETGLIPVLPCVLKVQVPVGGRGKAGGILVVRSEEELASGFEKLQSVTVAGHTPSCIYAEELLDIDRELYLSLRIDRESASIELMAHAEGGIEVEDQDADSFMRVSLREYSVDAATQAIADIFDMPGSAFVLADFVEKLVSCFVQNDATLCEINPLVLTAGGQLVAGDCKMELDDAAGFRHPDWDFVAKPADANFVALDTDGTVATIANGAGLAMATVDAVAAKGMVPANFLDIGGGATVEKITASFRKIMEFKHVNAIVINIFGGIVRCDTVAAAIIEARQSISGLPSLAIRLSGTNAEQAGDMLAEHDITLHASLEEALESISS